MKLCECGCGAPTRIITQSSTKLGRVKGQYNRFITGHYARVMKRGSTWKHGHLTPSGYVDLYMPGHPHARAGGCVREHLVIVERALGKSIPRRAQVHHVNRNRADNRPGNLVLCEDTAYHRLLHIRQDALNACGNAHWLRCVHCNRWDDPAGMYVRPGHLEARHRHCHAAYRMDLKRRHRERVAL